MQYDPSSRYAQKMMVAGYLIGREEEGVSEEEVTEDLNLAGSSVSEALGMLMSEGAAHRGENGRYYWSEYDLNGDR